MERYSSASIASAASAPELKDVDVQGDTPGINDSDAPPKGDDDEFEFEFAGRPAREAGGEADDNTGEEDNDEGGRRLWLAARFDDGAQEHTAGKKGA